MGDKDLINKVANIPLAKPGFDALGVTAPIMMQVNPQGKWEKCAPDHMEEGRLRKLIAYLTESKVINAAKTYCTECAAENQKGDKTNYVPVLVLPTGIPADLLKCETKEENLEESILKAAQKKIGKTDAQKKKKRPLVMVPRFNDFDLMSQW